MPDVTDRPSGRAPATSRRTWVFRGVLVVVGGWALVLCATRIRYLATRGYAKVKPRTPVVFTLSDLPGSRRLTVVLRAAALTYRTTYASTRARQDLRLSVFCSTPPLWSECLADITVASATLG